MRVEICTDAQFVDIVAKGLMPAFAQLARYLVT